MPFSRSTSTQPVADLLRGDLRLDQNEFARIEQTSDVLFQAEHGGNAVGALVGADPLEGADAVVQGVGQDRGIPTVLPIEDLAVPPDFFAMIDHFAPALAGHLA